MVCFNCSSENIQSRSSVPTQIIHLDNRSYSYRTSNITTESAVLFWQEEVSQWLWKVLTPVVFVVGLFGNILIIIVMCRMKFWKKEPYMTYILLFILAISDITVLCTGLIREWIIAISGVDVRDISDFGCKCQVFMIYFSMQFSSWTLVNITFERFLVTRDTFQLCCIKVSKILKFVYIISIIITVFINLPLIVMNGLVHSENGSVCNNTSDEYYTFEEKYFVFIDLAWLSLIPFILMLIMNIFVGKTIQSTLQIQNNIGDQEYKKSQANKHKKLTRMLFWTSIYFLLATMPTSINFVFDTFLSKTTTPSAQTKANLELSTAILYLFQFTNYSANFYIYIIFKPAFRRNLPFGLGKSSSRPRRKETISLSNTLRSSMTVSEDTRVAPKSDHTEIHSKRNGNSIFTAHSITYTQHNQVLHELEDKNLDHLVSEGQLITNSTANRALTKPLTNISSSIALVSEINIVSDNCDTVDTSDV